MRLICPNCAAQYEVDEAVIPEAGRDVQCSNCGHTWWQERYPQAEAGAVTAPAEAPGPAAAATAALAEAAANAPAPRTTGETWPEEDALATEVPPPPARPVSTDEPDDEDTAGDTGNGAWPEAPDEHTAAKAPTWPEASPEDLVGTAAPIPAAATGSQPEDGDEAGEPADEHRLTSRTPRSLDDAVLDVLRQEAARETEARQREAEQAEDRPEPVTDPAVRERIEAMADGDAGNDTGGEDEAGRPERRLRRSKLPDVDEITSTLASQQVTAAAAAGGAAAAMAATSGSGRSGFRIGFTLMILIAIVIGALYSYADRIVAAAPSTAPAMQSFVRTVDTGRNWLDGAAMKATEAITSLTDDKDGDK